MSDSVLDKMLASSCIDYSPECGSLCSVGRCSHPPCVCPGLSWLPVGCTAHRDEGRVDILLHGGPRGGEVRGKGRGQISHNR